MQAPSLTKIREAASASPSQNSSSHLSSSLPLLDAMGQELGEKHEGVWHGIMTRLKGASEAENIASLLRSVPGVKWDPEDMVLMEGGASVVREDLVACFRFQMAYSHPVCALEQAQAAADFVTGRFSSSLKVFKSDDPCTESEATFDKGYVFIDEYFVGVLVIADED